MDLLRKTSCFLLLLTLVIFTSCERGQANNISVEKDASPLFFIIHADKGSLLPSPTNPMLGEIRLEGVDRSVLYFTMSESRRAGKMELEEFIHIWESGTEENEGYPIHAGVVHYEKGKIESQDLNLLLEDPQYFPEKHLLTFQCESFDAPIEEHVLENVNLYIDDSSRYNYTTPIEVE